MPSALNLTRRASGVYVLRLFVPKRLQAGVGSKEVHRSTGCRDRQLAMIVAAELAAQWHRALQDLKYMDPTKIAAGSLDLLGDGYIRLGEAAQLLGSDLRRLAGHLQWRKAPFFVMAAGWEGWAVDDVHDLSHEHDGLGQVTVDISEFALNQVGERGVVHRELQLRFSDEALAVAESSAGVAVCQFLAPPSLSRGFIVPLPGVTIQANQLLVRKRDVEGLRAWMATEQAATLPLQAEVRPALASPEVFSHCVPRHAETPLSEVLSRYVEAHRAFWRPNTLSTNEDRAAIFLSLAGDVPLREVDQDFMWSLVEKAKQLPDARHLVRRRFDQLTADANALIVLAEEHTLPRLTAQALAKLVAGFGEILNWAVKRGMLVRNPAAGLGEEAFKVVGGKRKAELEQRVPLSPDDLDKVFSAKWFSSGRGDRTKGGVFHFFRPYYYWLPLLGLYTGGRLNELSQLYLNDVKVDAEGGAYLDFNLDGEGKMDVDGAGGGAVDNSGKSLKNANATRVVPLHPRLLELGLLEYVGALREAGHSRLFPELKHDAVKGYGKAAGKWFNERFLGLELGLERDGTKTFHSLRHNFATALGDALVPTTIKAQLLGHARGDSVTEQRYDKGRQVGHLVPHLRQLSIALPQIAPFDANAGVEAVKDALKLKRSRGGLSNTFEKQ